MLQTHFGKVVFRFFLSFFGSFYDIKKMKADVDGSMNIMLTKNQSILNYLLTYFITICFLDRYCSHWSLRIFASRHCQALTYRTISITHIIPFSLFEN